MDRQDPIGSQGPPYQGDNLPKAVKAQEGEAWWWFDSLAVIKTTGADTAGQMTIVEITTPPGEGPLHVHHREDEGFWILEGDVTFQVGDETIHSSAGDYVFGPRDIPHGFSVGEGGSRMLFIFTPAGIEGLIREMSRPATSLTLPPPPEGPPDIERLQAIARKYGGELLV